MGSRGDHLPSSTAPLLLQLCTLPIIHHLCPFTYIISPYQTCQHFRNPIRRKHIRCCAKFYRFSRHAVNNRTFFVLRNGDGAFFFHQLQFLRTVFPHAREQHADHIFPKGTRNRTKEMGNRRPQTILRFILTERYSATNFYSHLKSIWCNIGVSRQKVFTVSGYVNWSSRRVSKPFYKTMNKPCRYVLND